MTDYATRALEVGAYLFYSPFRFALWLVGALAGFISMWVIEPLVTGFRAGNRLHNRIQNRWSWISSEEGWKEHWS